MLKVGEISTSSKSLAEGIFGGGNNFLLDNINVNFVTSMQEPGSSTGIGLYPNPATDKLDVRLNPSSLNVSDDLQVAIVDVLGAAVFSNTMKGQTSIALDISQLASGIYFVQVTGGNRQWKVRFVKE